MSAPRQARGGTLIVGGGFAGGYVARLLGKRGATIVSRENFMLYTPLLPEAAAGTLEPRHVVVPLRMMCPHAELILGSATVARRRGAHAHRRRPTPATSRSATSDLVISAGAVARTLPIPGLADHGLGFKDLADAIALRNHVLHRLDAADGRDRPDEIRRHLTFVFVGAGYAGVEALAELSDLVAARCATTRSSASAPQHWVLVDAAPKILSEIPSRLGEYAARELARRGVDIRVSTTLEPVEQDAAILSDGDRIETRHGRLDRRRPRAARVLHARPPARRARPCARRPDAPRRGPRARLGARRLRPRPERRDARTTPTRRPASTRCARPAGWRRTSRATPKPYRYRMLGQVATLGRYKGIAEVFGLRLRGFPAWFVTRTYHLYQLPLSHAKAARRHRLDGGALLPPRHRRARHARPSAAARRASRRDSRRRCHRGSETLTLAPSGR